MEREEDRMLKNGWVQTIPSHGIYDLTKNRQDKVLFQNDTNFGVFELPSSSKSINPMSEHQKINSEYVLLFL